MMTDSAPSTDADTVRAKNRAARAKAEKQPRAVADAIRFNFEALKAELEAFERAQAKAGWESLFGNKPVPPAEQFGRVLNSPYGALLMSWRFMASFPRIEPRPLTEGPLTEADAERQDEKLIELSLELAVNATRLSVLALAVDMMPVRPVQDARKVLPSIREAPEREAGRLLAAVGRGDAVAPAQAALPLYPDAPDALIRRVPLLNLIDSFGAPIMTKGRGAPLAMRVPLFFLMAMDERTRKAGGGRLVMTVKELRDALFGGRWSRRRDNSDRPDDWRRTRAALLKADSARMMLPGGGTARLFALWQEPGDRPDLDDPVVLEVRIPAGASGPMVDGEMVNVLGRRSAPKLRAYIGVESVNWQPGVTRVPHPRSGRFVWAGDPSAYPVFTQADRRDIAFGVGDTKKNRDRAEQDAPWQDLPGVEVTDRNATDPRTGVRGWRIVPAGAAEAFGRWRARQRRK